MVYELPDEKCLQFHLEEAIANLGFVSVQSSIDSLRTELRLRYQPYHSAMAGLVGTDSCKGRPGPRNPVENGS